MSNTWCILNQLEKNIIKKLSNTSIDEYETVFYKFYLEDLLNTNNTLDSNSIILLCISNSIILLLCIFCSDFENETQY